MSLVTDSGLIEPPFTLSKVLTFAANSGKAMHDGKELLKTCLLIHIGVKSLTNDRMELFGTCLRSNAKNTYYEITITINRTQDYYWGCNCTCKLFTGFDCKHVFAILLSFLK